MNAAGLDQMSAKIDDFAAELLMFGCDTWPESAGPVDCETTHEAAPSDVDPPKTALACLACTFGTVAASLVLGAIALFTFGTGDYFAIAFGVLAVALFFGPIQALTAAGTAALLHNFFLVGTPFHFDAPTKVEVTMTVFFLGLALATPWLADRAAKWRYRSLAIAPNRGLAKER
jgi:K+-sensing histidine kinase KdpD